jgi:hypothetical protein
MAGRAKHVQYYPVGWAGLIYSGLKALSRILDRATVPPNSLGCLIATGLEKPVATFFFTKHSN